jgi:hypothetical protein
MDSIESRKIDIPIPINLMGNEQCSPMSESGSHTQVLPPPPLMERSKSALSRDALQEKNEVGLKLVIVMMGLPARGKSYISKKLHR